MGTLTIMTRRDYSWLPEHQYHVAFTLAHADDLVARVGEILFDYLRPPGPLQLGNVADGDVAHVTVVAVAPLPAAVARFAADALTQLRAAIEHTIYAEVEHALGLRLKYDEARRVEMPVSTSEDAFSKWLTSRRRSNLSPLRDGTQLVRRLSDLQPYQCQDVDLHPLRVLAEHTNLAKHRTPAVAATLLGAVIPDRHTPGLLIATGNVQPVQPGDVLASGPLYERVPLSIWPKVSIQRPHTETWHVVMNELGELADWVRTVAIPHLVAGTRDVDPLPPQVDTTIGYADPRAALSSSGGVPAAERATRRIQASVVRQGLAETLALHPDRIGSEVIQTWLGTLDDDQVLERQDRLSGPAKSRDHRRVNAVVRDLIAEALQAKGRNEPSP